MSVKLRYPDFSVPSPVDPMKRLHSYLYQVIDELNIALDSVESKADEAHQAATAAAASAGAASEKGAQSTFNSIKSLIIKSADIVNAYYEVINRRLEGLYVAESDFGTYTEETSQTITENSTGIEMLFTNFQSIITDLENMEHTLIEVNAHIHPGLLYYDEEGIPVYGLEIGQRTEIDGEEVFNKYARFTSDKLSFYDSNNNEVAYISDKKLFITHVEVTGSFKIGSLTDTALSDGSVVTRYIATSGGDS